MLILGASWALVKASFRHTTRKEEAEVDFAWTVPRNVLTLILGDRKDTPSHASKAAHSQWYSEWWFVVLRSFSRSRNIDEERQP